MKKILMLTGVAIALCGVTSCSDENVASIDPVSTQAEENTPISFGTYVGNNKSTRAGDAGQMTTEKLTTSGFGVFAYNTGTKLFDKDISDYETANKTVRVADYMYNTKVTGSGSNNAYTWTPEVVKYWPNPTMDPQSLTPAPQYVTFLAYAPYVDSPVSDDVGITGFDYYGKLKDIGQYSANSNYSDLFVHYSTKPNVGYDANGVAYADNVDLLWGTAGSNDKAAKIDDYSGDLPTNSGKNYQNTSNETESRVNPYSVNADLTKMRTDGKVQFKFKHALSAVGGSPQGPVNNSGNGILIDYYADYKDGGADHPWQPGNTPQGDAADSKTRVYVNWIAVEFMSNMTGSDGKYTKVPTAGWFDLVTGQWYMDKGENASGTPTYTAETRPRLIYYFTPDGGDYETDGRGYDKYVQLYKNNGTSADDITVYRKKLNNAFFNQSSNGYNVYADWVATRENDDKTATIGYWKQGNNIGVVQTARAVYQDATSPTLFIPGTKLSAKVVVNYDIVTADANIGDPNTGDHYTVTHQEMAKQVDFTSTMIMNRLYALYIHLGLTSIHLDAVVDAFGTDTPDTDDNVTTTVAETEEVTISPNEVP